MSPARREGKNPAVTVTREKQGEMRWLVDKSGFETRRETEIRRCQVNLCQSQGAHPTSVISHPRGSGVMTRSKEHARAVLCFDFSGSFSFDVLISGGPKQH